MEPTIESLCNQLARLKLLDPELVRSLHGRWRSAAAADVNNPQKFGKWLVSSKFLTEFQADLLLRGLGDLLFIDNYKLLERIGQGRMAGVYKAEHQLGAVVAIKVLPPSKAAHSHLLARFQREARLAQRLNHPNTVRTFQQGQTRGGLNYIVMEYLDGEGLDEVLNRRRRLPVPEALHVTLQALEGLQHLHEEGLVHRDLKPSNLMLIPGTKPGQPDTTLNSVVKILDIGLGRALFDEGISGLPDNPELTAEGALLGTPHYMAPEQARNAKLADIRSDIYSLGCVLYEMLAGEVPFPDTSLMRQLVRHATESLRPLRDINKEVSPELQEVVEKMLAKDPATRYSLPSQVIKALKPLLDPKVERRTASEDTPQMQNFVRWVTTRLSVDPPAEDKPDRAPAEPVPPACPVPVAVTPANPRPTAEAPVALAPIPLPQGSVTGPVPQAQPARVAAPAKPPPPTKPVMPPAQANSPEPVGQAVAAATTPMPTAGETGPPQVPFSPWSSPAAKLQARLKSLLGRLRALTISRRDLVCAAIGAGTLLLLEVLVWLVWRLVQ